MNDSNNLGGTRLLSALGFGPFAATGDDGAAGSSSAGGTGGSSGAAGGVELGAAGLGIDEFIDPVAGSAWAGADTARHSDMLALPGNALNIVELMQLRERNHIVVREHARQTGDRRTLMLDTVGLELMQALQRDIERSHFSQAEAGSARTVPDAREGSLIHAPTTETAAGFEAAEDPRPERSETSSERARSQAADQRVALLALVNEAQGQAALDLAALNRAEGTAHTLRDLQVESSGSSETQLEQSTSELRADRAEEVEAQFRAQSSASLSRAMRLAAATQGRRLGLQNLLHGRAPR